MSRRRSISQQLSAIGLLLILAHVAGGLLMALLLKIVGDERSTFAELAAFYGWFGCVFAQIACVSLWLAFGRGSLAGRFILSVFAAACLWWLHFVLIAKSVLPNSNPMAPGLAMLAQWCLLSATFGVWRWRGWELRNDWTPDAAGTAGQSQFGVRHLLILTTLVAIVTATVKSLSRTYGHLGEIVELLLFVLVNGLFTWTLIFAGLRGERPWWGTVAALAWVIAMTVLETAILRVIGRGAMPQDLGLRVFLANITQVGLIAVTAVALRLAGYRLQRRPTGA